MRDRATAYAQRVAAGDVVAGELHIQACRRHLRDLERQGTDEFPYLWVPEKSEEILDFAETLTLLEGDEPRPVRLYGCQTFDLGVPMGWVNRKGYRRFRRKYKSVARQNGKTFENGRLPGGLWRLPLRKTLHRGHENTAGPAGLGRGGAVHSGRRRSDGVLPHPGP